MIKKSLFEEVNQEQPSANPDLTLGIGSLLSIFFGVVLICGIFFGFGYSMGRRNMRPATVPVATQQPPAVVPAPTPAPTVDSSDTTAKAPAADGSSAFPPDFNAPKPDETKSHAAPSSVSASAGNRGASGNATGRPDIAPNSKVVAPEEPGTALTPAPTARHTPSTTKPHAGVMALPASAPAAEATGQPVPGQPLMVQIAAVSRQEDAEVLAGALRRRGFNPQVHGGAADKFFHVQVGPFTDKAAAESMKQRLLADGYNAILK